MTALGVRQVLTTITMERLKMLKGLQILQVKTKWDPLVELICLKYLLVQMISHKVSMSRKYFLLVYPATTIRDNLTIQIRESRSQQEALKKEEISMKRPKVSDITLLGRRLDRVPLEKSNWVHIYSLGKR
jgi:hypothetical protein